ncbi:MAG: hypothetical protein FWE34_02135 [Defluviitaleaceae bacterium]|nr:hypothetical protein [Defluviitaleaceae bacterium]
MKNIWAKLLIVTFILQIFILIGNLSFTFTIFGGFDGSGGGLASLQQLLWNVTAIYFMPFAILPAFFLTLACLVAGFIGIRRYIKYNTSSKLFTTFLLSQ